MVEEGEVSTTMNLTVCFADVAAHARVAEVVAVTMAGEFVVVGPKDAKAFDFRPARLIAVGPEGGAALARWVAEHGLDGVTGVGLVSVTAPWAERWASVQAPRCPKCFGERTRPDTDDCKHWICACGWAFTPLPLGPLEPLRAVAERARRGQMCAHESCILSGQDCGERVYPFRFVVACAPDDGVCVGCRGKAAHQYRKGSAYNMLCAPCLGTGKALSSADVAKELLGAPNGADVRYSEGRPGTSARAGGLSVVSYQSRAALDEHGLRAVVERLTR